MVGTLLLIALAAAEPCKDCWVARCAELKGYGVPGCATKATEKRPPAPAPATTPPPPPAAPRSPPSPANSGIEWVRSQGLTIAKSETTVAQYRRCFDAGACSAPDTDGEATWNGGKEDHPINNVDWHKATAFCHWAGGRLPTADEWQRVASNGGTTEYPWGDAAPDGSRANFCDRSCEYQWKADDADDSFAATSPACAYPAGRNQDRACDLAGNAFEWTSSAYASGNKEFRGGSWYNLPPNLRASNRNWDKPGYRYVNIGFRCAVAPVVDAGTTVVPVVAAPIIPPGFVLVARKEGLQLGKASDVGPLDRALHAADIAAFALMPAEVTRADFQLFLDATRPGVKLPGPPEQPIVGVAHDVAIAFCAWKTPGGRLPSEDEWERAARGDGTTPYPWGEDFRPACVADSVEAATAVKDDCKGPSGVVHLIGNVWEWTSSPMTKPGSDVVAPGMFVTRGGSFATPRDRLDANARAPARAADDKTGFRCAVDLGN